MRADQAVVVLSAARDGYQLPLALFEAGQLDAMVTELYWPADRAWFRAAVSALPGSLIEARYRPGLPSDRVRLALPALAASIWMKATRTRGLHTFADAALGHRAQRLAIDHGAPLFAYSYYARSAFRNVANRIAKRFIFQLHPHPRVVRRLLLEELERVPVASKSLRAEHELSMPARDFDDLAAEPHLANGWVVASQFSAATLAEQGIPRDRIHVVPYGVNLDAFPARSMPRSPSGPIRVIFVGSLIQRKGLRDLLEAARIVGPSGVHVTLCGRGVVDDALLREYSDVNPAVHRGLSREALVAELHRSDLFVLPSIAEGFAHVVLEAMATGVPVVASTNTCAPDIVRPGIDGWVVPIRSPAAIAERITWALEHRAELASLGEAASARAREFTWERFRARIRAAYTSMLRDDG